MESNTWKTLRRALKSLDPVRIENRLEKGTPDVNFLYGWIEVKQIDKWPVRKETPLRVPHFSPDQRTWLRRRWRAGGLAAVAIKVERDWLLFDGPVAASILGHNDKRFLIKEARGHWVGQLKDEEQWEKKQQLRSRIRSKYAVLMDLVDQADAEVLQALPGFRIKHWSGAQMLWIFMVLLHVNAKRLYQSASGDVGMKTKTWRLDVAKVLAGVHEPFEVSLCSTLCMCLLVELY